MTLEHAQNQLPPPHIEYDQLRQLNEQLQRENAELREQIVQLSQRLQWFEKQIFGQKSEKQPQLIPGQGSLFSKVELPTPTTEIPTQKITYERGTAKKMRPDDCVTDSGLRFGPQVPVIVIPVVAPELQGENADDYCVIDTKVTHKLAQRPESYVILRYETPVLKRKSTLKISSPVMPPALFEGSIADVSLVVGLLVEKFQYHMPLYRQHQKMQANGITISRASLIKWVQLAIALLKLIVDAQLQSVLTSKNLILDETPIKAGKKQKKDKDKKGKMHQGQIWPIYGDQDEIVFTYASRRATEHIKTCLKDFKGTILSDGYAAYARFTQQTDGIIHAQCWAHGRRKFIEAENTAPEMAAQALQFIGGIYHHEALIREANLSTEEKCLYRQAQIKPIVDAFFDWAKATIDQPELTPQHPMRKALNYLIVREANLRVFLNDASVAPDTNAIERQIRGIAMGRKNWMFCWTELGAEHLAIIQSLICTCKLQGIDPKVYLLDVLQRVGIHPANRVAELTPRLWKTLFADKPMGNVF